MLTGRGRLSCMRFPEPEQAPAAPLYGASMPAMLAGRKDALGGVVLTLVHDRVGCTASVLGTGLAGDEAGAEAFLSTWVEELERSQCECRRGL